MNDEIANLIPLRFFLGIVIRLFSGHIFTQHSTSVDAIAEHFMEFRTLFGSFFMQIQQRLKLNDFRINFLYMPFNDIDRDREKKKTIKLR